MHPYRSARCVYSHLSTAVLLMQKAQVQNRWGMGFAITVANAATRRRDALRQLPEPFSWPISPPAMIPPAKAASAKVVLRGDQDHPPL